MNIPLHVYWYNERCIAGEANKTSKQQGIQSRMYAYTSMYMYVSVHVHINMNILLYTHFYIERYSQL